MNTPGVEKQFIAEMTAEIGVLEQRLVDGSGIPDYNTYVAQVARRQGLVIALKRYQELLRNIEEAANA